VRKYRNIKGNLQPKRILKYSEEWIEYRKKRGADSVKVEHCDVDTDGFHDAIVRDWRSPALKKQQTCIIPVPEGGPLDLTAQIQIPQGGPRDLSALIAPPGSGPLLLEASVYQPASLTGLPYDDRSMVGCADVGVPEVAPSSIPNYDSKIQIGTAITFILVDTCGVGSGTPPTFRYTFQSWSTNLPMTTSEKSSPNWDGTGPWISGGAYTARPIYTREQIS
jgi:hypothetical protein